MIDFSQIPVERTGVGAYAEGLVRELLPVLHDPDSLVLLVQSDDSRIRELVRDHRNVAVSWLPSRLFRSRVLLLLFEQTVLPFLLLRLRIDVLHSLHYTHPLLSPCLRVITIHDLTFLLFPSLHTRGRRAIMPFFIKRALKKGEGLIFVSEATRADAEARSSPGTSLRRVIPLAVDGPCSNPSTQDCSQILERRQIRPPFLLFVGTIEPRKNLLRLISSFERVAESLPEVHLVLAGKPGWQCKETLQAFESSPAHERIHYLGFIREEEKRCLLAHCSILIYPSLYEGFGLPVLEGMAAGAPVITSHVSSLPEVAGSAARLIHPLSEVEITEAILELMNDPERRKAMSSAGRERAKMFNWRRVATETLQFYREVFEQRLQDRARAPLSTRERS